MNSHILCFFRILLDKDYCIRRPEGEDNDLIITRDVDCTTNQPCQKCEGDCDSDSQCIGSFICFQRDGLTNVPGCVGNGISGKSNNNIIINIITSIS